jgi:septal ring factor EnvC (AmiA/AmiB activator)
LLQKVRTLFYSTKIYVQYTRITIQFSDFNNNIDSRKEEAMRQLEKLNDIQQQIDEAKKTTTEAEADIGGAKLDAEQAEKLAEKARENAENIAKVGQKLSH